MDYRDSKKMKAFKAYVPKNELEINRVVSDYKSNNEKMLTLLRQAQTKKLRSTKVPVSIAKYLKVNVGDIIQVVVFHEERHIQKVIEVLG